MRIQSIHVELDPGQPVPEICAVISTLLTYHPGHEREILKQVQAAIAQHTEGVTKEGGKPIREPAGQQQD